MQTKTGLATLSYEEPLHGLLPTQLVEIAAVCWVGFRFLSPPNIAIENVVVGKDRLPAFKGAKSSELTRILKLHFKSARVKFAGEELRLTDWVTKWRADAALRKIVLEHPAHAKWVEGLTVRFTGEPLVALAEESGRSCYGKLGGDAATLKAMHGFMDDGGI
jgi:hypothetical protein